MLSFFRENILKMIFIVLVVFSGVIIAGNISFGTAGEAVIEEVKVVSDNVKKIEDCRNISYEEEENVYGTCVNEIINTVCDDEPLNKSCHDEIEEINYECFKEKKKVNKIKKECKEKEIVVNDAVNLELKEYSCSTSEEKGKVIAVCDSKYDGNGDGICSSGESCQKIVIDEDRYEKYMKNSRDDFVPDDDSFFLGEIRVEVEK